MAAHLSYGKVNLNILREAARKDLREFLDKCAGSKVASTHKHKGGGKESNCSLHPQRRSIVELEAVERIDNVVLRHMVLLWCSF